MKWLGSKMVHWNAKKKTVKKPSFAPFPTRKTSPYYGSIKSILSNNGLCSKPVNWHVNNSTLSQTSLCFHMFALHVFRKHCWKRRNCSSWAISPFPTVFSTHLENVPPFPSNSKLSSANSFCLEESKICRLVKVNIKFWPILAWVDCAGWYGPILFANALSPL